MRPTPPPASTIRPPPVGASLRGGLLTASIWALSLLSLLIGGSIASLFVMMPVSLDFGEMIAAGADPWRDAATAAVGFCLLFAASALALTLWHRGRAGGRARLAAWAITAAEVALVAWGGAVVLRDWF